MIKVKTCPQCGSANIHLHMGAMTGVQYKCEMCGYIGALIVEQDIDKQG